MVSSIYNIYKISILIEIQKKKKNMTDGLGPIPYITSLIWSSIRVKSPIKRTLCSKKQKFNIFISNEATIKQLLNLYWTRL